MILDLTDTSASKINGALIDSRRRSGSPAMGMVLTLIIVTDEASQYDALKAATEAAREHPSRILAVVKRPGRGLPRLDAEVRVGGESGPGEVVLLRLHGPLAEHAESVALPLLLPDAPVVTWWPGAAPENPCEDALGAIAQRRVTDAAACPNPLEQLHRRAVGYSPGDTDLSWTRITTWRSLLASALDERFDPLQSVEVSAEADSPSAELLALWLGDRLAVPVERRTSEGPGITAVRLRTASGDIAVTRPDGRMAMMERPGWPDRPIALHRRNTSELISEELRRLDPDDVYGVTLRLVGGDVDPDQSRATVVSAHADARGNAEGAMTTGRDRAAADDLTGPSEAAAESAGAQAGGSRAGATATDGSATDGSATDGSGGPEDGPGPDGEPASASEGETTVGSS
jgi:glucose-6-phosphate dehydrogenase assembly protein OpcA